MADIPIVVTVGVRDTLEALGAVFPATSRESRTVHPIRNTLHYADWKESDPLLGAHNAGAAATVTDEFKQGPGGHKYPSAAAAWLKTWYRVILFVASPRMFAGRFA